MKKILSILLVVTMLAAVLTLTACKTDDENGNQTDNNNPATNDNTYTVKVTNEDGEPLAGVSIFESANYTTLVTDANGIVTFESDKTDVQVMVMNAPEGYEDPAKVAIPFPESKELGIVMRKIVKSEVLYTVTVIDAVDGTPIAGVLVQLCTDSGCFDTTTDENGIGTKELLPNIEYQVKITAVPEGYVAPDGYFTTIPKGETELVIELECE